MAQTLHAMIDVSSLPYGRGVSRYTSNLVESLLDQPQVDLRLFGYSARRFTELASWANQYGSQVEKSLWRLPPSGLHWLWRQSALFSPAFFVGKTDVFHAWDWQLAPVGTMRQVVTIHDLAYRLYPETAHPDVVARYDRLLATLEKHPEIHVIAVSESTKKDIINLTALPEEQITVIYEALPREAKYVPSESEVARVKKSLPGNKPFLMTVGTTEPRKNIPRVIEAWKKIRDQFDLYIIGDAGWDALQLESGVYPLGYVEPTRLSSLYRLAHALVYTSLYEGFGLPILEAYFHGCPVVTSQISSMAEIAGPGAALVDPYNPAAIAEACLAIEANGSAQRQQRIQKMQATLQLFSWDTAAKETVAVYEKVRQQG